MRRLRPRERLVERGQTIDRRLEVGKADIVVDEEVHRIIDIAKGVGGLIEDAERHFFR